MKKITYSLRIGIIGNKESNRKIFLDNLTSRAVNYDIQTGLAEFLVVFNEIPIKVKTFLVENLDEMVYNLDQIERLNILIFAVNLYEPNSMNRFNKIDIEDFFNVFSFQGISILVGIDIEQVFKETPSNKFKISRFHLEKKAKDLDFFYCYEIFNKEEDVSEIYNKIFHEFLFRFQYSNPDLFEKARHYGMYLVRNYKQQSKFKHKKDTKLLK